MGSGQPPASTSTADTDPEGTPRPSRALDLMGVVAAQEAVARSGSTNAPPVRVAVLGSGVLEAPATGITVRETKSFVATLTWAGPAADPSATIAAGLIAAEPRDGDEQAGRDRSGTQRWSTSASTSTRCRPTDAAQPRPRTSSPRG